MIDDAEALGDPQNLEPPRAARPAARRRLGLVAFNFGYRFVAGLLVAGPFAALLNSAVANELRGDAVLFDPGGVMLLESFRLAGRGIAGASSASGTIALFATFLGLLPFAALVAGLGREGRLSRGYLAARAVRPIGTLALLWGVGLLAQAILAGLLALLGGKLVGVLHLGTPGEDIGRLVLTAVVLLAVLAIGVVRDLAAVSAVNDGTRLYTSVQRAFRVARRAGGRVAFAYFLRAALSVGVVLGAWVSVTSLRSPGNVPVALPFLIHQLAIFAVVFLEASWLAAGIGLIQRIAPIDPPSSAAAESAPVPVVASASAAESAPASAPESAPVPAAAPAAAAAAESEPPHEGG